MDKKGVSEVVGYLITFGIVVTVVGVIYSTGMPVVDDTKEKSAFLSMETSFMTLQSHVKKVAFGQSPLRTMKLNLILGSIGTNDDAGNIVVTVDGSPHNISFGNIEYTIDSRKVVYELGAVIESTPGGSIIISDPPIFNSSGDVFISVINVSGGFSAGGGMAEMHMGGPGGLYNVTSDTHVYNSSDFVSSLDISISSTSYQAAWDRYLNDEFGGSTVTNCTLTLVSHDVTIS
jgi:flagellin-like protein